MCRQVLLDLTFGSTSCQCQFLTDLSKWFQAYNLRNTGIFGIIFSQAKLTTTFWYHEVTKWHLRREATHDHAVHGVQVSLQDSNKYYVFNFWYLLGLSRSTTHVASIIWKLTIMSNVMIYSTSTWRQVIFQRSDMRSGDFASSCRGRL